MGTSKRFKPENNCTRCGFNVINMSREAQDLHEKNCIAQKKLHEMWGFQSIPTEQQKRDD